MYAGIRQIPVHTVDLGQIPASAFGTDIHLKFLVPTIVTISQGQIHSLIEPHFHSAANQGLDCFQVVADWIFHILNFSAVA